MTIKEKQNIQHCRNSSKFQLKNVDSVKIDTPNLQLFVGEFMS